MDEIDQSSAGADDDQYEMQLDAPEASTAPANGTGSTAAHGGTRPMSPGDTVEMPVTDTTELSGAALTPINGADAAMSDEVATKREEGVIERSLQEAEGEAATEMMGGGHNIGGGSAV